jgi:hypothetical protein
MITEYTRLGQENNNMDTLVIGFGYKARHGKDTAAQAIIDAYPQYDVRKYPFAAALKAEVNQAAEKAGGFEFLIAQMRFTHNLPDWVVYEPNADMSDPMCPLGKQRTLLQWWGTEYRRAQDPYYWVKKTNKKIEIDKPQVALITDMRFPNEFWWVQSVDGVTCKVERAGFLDSHANAHSSENAIADAPFDFEILHGEGDIEGLKQAAVEMFEQIKRFKFDVPEDELDYTVGG